MHERWADISVLVDIFNLFNDDAINDVNTSSGGSFEEPRGIINAREINIGLRWTF